MPNKNRTKDQIISSLEQVVEMYERVFTLSRQELKQAYKTNKAHEAVEELSREERLKADEELKLINHMSSIKTNFFSNISHEIRTPITLLIAPLESMLEGEVGELNHEQNAYLQLMYENSKRLLKMVNELLDYSKIEAGQMKLFYQEQNFYNLVKKVLESFVPYAEKNNIKYEMDIKKSKTTLYIDISVIEKVIINLVFNAFKYVEDNGTVKIKVKEKNDSVSFSVFNSGKGIPKDMVPKVFDRYTQFENFSHKPNSVGTGLGLALSKEFIHLHKGSIQMKSTKNKGTTCQFTLPRGRKHIQKELLEMGWGDLERRKDEKGNITRTLPSNGASSLYSEIDDFYSLRRTDLKKFEECIKKKEPVSKTAVKNKEKVLIVEDNNEMRGFLRYVLSNYFNIYDASDGEQGYKKAQSILPDLIIADVMMPKMNGREMTKLIKKNKKTCRIPVILLTARANNVDAMIEGLNIGADDYISKPFNIKELIARSNALLRMASLNSQLESREGVIFSLANAVEAKDSYTEGHCFRLAELSTEIGKKLGLNEQDLNSIKNGAILHDVGKIGIPEAILTKPSRLTEDEIKIIKEHPLIGEKICKPLKTTTNILPIIRHHHERFDGKGYPDGLKGEAIPIEARIVSIADALDAMAYDRVYKIGMGLEKAREVFLKERLSGQWDPEIVDAFLSIDEKWLLSNDLLNIKI